MLVLFKKWLYSQLFFMANVMAAELAWYMQIWLDHHNYSKDSFHMVLNISW